METEISQPEFEFGSFTKPTSPKSPADYLFHNGRLLPHSFPVQIDDVDRLASYSRASSINSLNSLLSSRSSSVVSRTSSCNSSERTSTSIESSGQRKAFRKDERLKPKKTSVHQYVRSSRQWQFIAPVPVMKQGSRRKKSEILAREKKNKIKGECYCWRVLRWFVWVCQKCHSIE